MAIGTPKAPRQHSAERLLSQHHTDIEMEHIEEPQSKGGQTTVSHVTAGPSFDASVYEQHQPTQHVEYRVYKRRWFGLIQLVLLNIAVSWDVSGIASFALVLG